jgi:hypothetical protein
MCWGSPLHQNQLRYQVRKSSETTLHTVVMWIEDAIKRKEVAVGAFLDIEGTFDGTVIRTANWHGVEPAVSRWISFMLESRSMVAALSEWFGGGDHWGSYNLMLPSGGSFVTPWCGARSWMSFLGSSVEGWYVVAEDIATLINREFPSSKQRFPDRSEWERGSIYALTF